MKHIPQNLDGCKVTVVGLGRFGGGVGVTRWLVGQGAKVTVSDSASATSLQDSINALQDLDVTFHIGNHCEDDILQADLLVVNPAVPKEADILRLAQQNEIPRTSEINLFLERCPARVIGITGSVGKSTTTAMTGEILSKRYRTFVGGNIGGSLLGELDKMTADDVVVLELSSFQLEDLPIIAKSPCVALVTNLAPNHLDRHGTIDAYAACKKNIYKFQTADDLLILNGEDETVSQWAADAPGRVEKFDLAASEPFDLAVPGKHNQQNAQAAWAIAKEFGVTRDEAQEALSTFRGLPHRLEYVAQKNGLRFFNDSKCTTPGGACVALEAFEPNEVVILLGGYDKGASFSELAEVALQCAYGVVAFGATRGEIFAAIEKKRDNEELRTASVADLPHAFKEAVALAPENGVVLLSPACASYDQFDNYEKRGELFTELVEAL